jgi:PAS domain S-box-containing protein
VVQALITGFVLVSLLALVALLALLAAVRSAQRERFEHVHDAKRIATLAEKREAAEAALAHERARRADSEARFRRLAESSPELIAFWRLRPEPHFTWISPALRTVVGLDPADVLARPDALLAEVFPRDLPALTAALADPSSVEQPLLVRWFRQGGNLAWTEVTFVAATEPDGTPAGVDFTAHDVTARMLALEEREDLVHSLTHERAWLTAVLEHSPVGMLLVPARGEGVVPNARAVELLGDDVAWSRGPSAYVGRLCCPEGRPLAADELPSARALRGETVMRQELLVCRGEAQTPVWVYAAPIGSEADERPGAVVLFEDVSAVKELERMREEWTSIVAHDLRQPITGILGMAGLLASRPTTSPELAEKLRGIDRAARRLDGMVRDLLDASRLDVRQLALHRLELEPEPVLREMLGRLQALFPERPLELRVDGSIPPISADPDRLEQVVGNLVSNAVRYGTPGTPVQVALAARDGQVHVDVTNRGEGIAPEELPGLFRRFGRTRTGRRTGSGGIGLGLYICRGLVEAHGGRLTVESTPGATTTFRVALPVAPPPAAAVG